MIKSIELFLRLLFTRNPAKRTTIRRSVGAKYRRKKCTDTINPLSTGREE